MKKLFAAVIIALYLCSILGVSATSYYCCGKLTGTSFNIGDANGANDKAKGETENCCKTTKQTFKVKDTHVGADVLNIAVNHFSTPVVTTSFLPLPVLIEQRTLAYQSHAPPLRQQVPVYLLNCTYRI